MSNERKDEVMAKIFSFDSDVDSEEALSEWIEQQSDAIEIHKLIASTLDAFTKKGN